ncbi:MAG: hypothetical protein ABIJ52_16565 [Pseudomonadota bacterium]|nr:hypothetical protein [Pseudomonadota bacterium]MBU1713894.1 hypothetical protein [Pseudomonadota bacterium]
MNLPPKTVTCKCGHAYATELKESWCIKCGHRVFYYEKDRRSNKIRNYFMLSMGLVILTFLMYIIIEVLVKPLTTM